MVGHRGRRGAAGRPPRASIASIAFIADIEAAPVRRLLRETEEAIAAGAREVRLLMSSHGGNLYWGFTLYNHLRSLPVRLTTVNVGFVNSMAVPVYCAGQVRLSAPHAKFLLHQPALYPEPRGVRWTPDRIRERLESVSVDAENIARIIAAASRRPSRRVRGDLERRLALDAPAARAYGLVHRVTRRYQAPRRVLLT
jgi:ATP-dependent Clp protease protease subunit